MNGFLVCVEVKTGSIKKFVDYLEGSVTEEPPFYEHCCQQLLVHLITYATNRVVITDSRWYAVVEISDEPQLKDDTLHLPIRCKAVDSFSTDIHSLTPTVVLLYCAIKSRDNPTKEQELIIKVREEVHYKKMVKMFRCDAKFEDMKRKVLESRSISVISRPEMRRIAFPHEVIWLTFHYDYQKPLNFTILQEGDYNSKVLQIGRDLFPDFFERMSSIPTEADIVILKVYDDFMLKNPRHELAFGFESPEQFFMYQLNERYLPEVASLKYIEGHNNANPGNKINAPKLHDCGQLEMVLDDSNDFVWRILETGCFLLVEYVQDCGDFAFTQLSLTTGLEQIKMLSKLGIHRLDIKRSNTRVQLDGTIFLIDYSHVKLYDPQNLEECSSSFESMKKSFLSMMKGLGFEMAPVTESEVSEGEPV
jgi:hypothetical protein